MGRYYLWGVQSAGYGFQWGHDLGGYYDYLGRGFAHGHLYLPIEPSPKLLAFANPWDPAVDPEFTMKMQDMALYHGHYYLYHGVAPAVLLFVPWRLATGHDLPENFALFLLSFGGFLFSCGALLRLLELARARPGPLLVAVMLVALGVCQSVPYLLSRVWVYEIAIGGGYFCLSGAVFFLVRGIDSPRSRYWLAASGLMFGLAVACRPHLALAAGVVLVYLVARLAGRGHSPLGPPLAFAVSLALAGAALALYNYARFGNPFEFGVHYLLTGAHQNRINLAARNILPGLYFNLFSPPDFSPVFPWVRLAFHNPFNSPQYPFPPEYFMEPIVGALYLAPFMVAGLVAPPRIRGLVWTLVASSAAVLLFLAATGFTTQRYEVDFLPLAVLGGLASLGAWIGGSSGIRRAALSTALAVAVLYGSVANLALGISGPYDEMWKNRPQRYARLARWLSPIERFRPVLNPRLSIAFTAEIAAGIRKPLLTIGGQPCVYSLYAERLPGKLRITSQSATSTVTAEMEDPGSKPLEIAVTFSPESGKLAATINGNQVLSHDIAPLLAAPSQVVVGK